MGPLRRLVSDLGYYDPIAEKDVLLSVQTRRPAEGITDLEIQIGTSFFAILEAKRGSALPTETRTVDEIKAPFVWGSERPVRVTTRLTDIKHNVPIDDTKFKSPLDN